MTCPSRSGSHIQLSPSPPVNHSPQSPVVDKHTFPLAETTPPRWGGLPPTTLTSIDLLTPTSSSHTRPVPHPLPPLTHPVPLTPALTPPHPLICSPPSPLLPNHLSSGPLYLPLQRALTHNFNISHPTLPALAPPHPQPNLRVHSQLHWE